MRDVELSPKLGSVGFSIRTIANSARYQRTKYGVLKLSHCAPNGLKTRGSDQSIPAWVSELAKPGVGTGWGAYIVCS